MQVDSVPELTPAASGPVRCKACPIPATNLCRLAQLYPAGCQGVIAGDPLWVSEAHRPLVSPDDAPAIADKLTVKIDTCKHRIDCSCLVSWRCDRSGQPTEVVDREVCRVCTVNSG